VLQRDFGFACQELAFACQELAFACQASGSFLALAFGDVTVARLRRRYA
jgi:hypothetical protein